MARPEEQVGTSVYQIKVTLVGSHPPIWRTLQVTGDTTLGELHEILQVAIGWEDEHPHEFRVADQRYGEPGGRSEVEDEYTVLLSQVADGEGFTFTYLYDFSDKWEHELLVEATFPPEPGQYYPVCVDGERAAPPEDIGGIYGYVVMLDAISETTHPEHEEMVAYVGKDYDPEFFDVDEVNEVLHLED